MCMYNNKLHCDLVDVNNSNNKLNWLSYIPRAFYKMAHGIPYTPDQRLNKQFDY